MAVAADYTQVAEQLYLAYFGRPADRDGLANMTANLAASGAPTDIAGFKAAYATNSTVKAILDNFGNSAESQALYGTGSDAAFIVSIFQHVLNRDPLLAGLDYWTAALRNKEMTRAEAAAQIVAAATKVDADATDLATVTKKVAVATNFTAAIDTAAEVLGYSGKAAAQAARDMLTSVTSTTDVTAFNSTVTSVLDGLAHPVTPATDFVLTTAANNFQGGAGNDTFAGLVDATTPANSTLTLTDVLAGSSGNDTLNVTVNGAGDAAGGAVISGIETINVRTVTGAAATLDASTTVGATTINSTGNGTLVATNLAADAVIGVVGNGTVVHGEVAFGYASASSKVTLNVSGGVNMTAGITARAAGLGGTATGTATTAVINSTGTADNVVGTVDLANATLTSVTINAAASLSGDLLSQATDQVGASGAVVVTGAATLVEFTAALDNTIKTIDASAMTAGGISATVGTGTEDVKGGAGADTVVLNTGIKTATFGAGDDTVTTAAVAATAAGAIAGGAGNDTLIVAAASDVNSAAKRAVYTGFEVLSNATGAAIAADGFTGITSVVSKSDHGGYTGLTAGQAAAVTNTVDQTSVTYALGTATGTSDVLSVVLKNATKTASADLASATVDGFETLNVTASSGNVDETNAAASIVSFASATDLTTINVAGAYAVNLILDNTAKAVTVNNTLSGTAAMRVEGEVIKGSTITTTANGDTIETALAAVAGVQGDFVTYNAGAGDDAISTSLTALNNTSTSAASLKINGGAGTDTLTFAAADATFVDSNFQYVTGVEKVTLANTTNLSFSSGGFFDTNFKASGVTLTTGSTADNATQTIDLTSFTGAAKIVSTVNGQGVGTDTVSITTGTGADDVAVTASSWVGQAGAAANFTVSTGAGADKIAVTLGNLLATTSGTITVNAGTGADTVTVTHANSTTATALINFVIADGDSTAAGRDKITGFLQADGTNRSDVLDLQGTPTVTANTAGANGTDAGTIKSHAISNGVITFDDVDTFAAAVVVNQANLADVLAYLAANITTAGDTVAFAYDSDSSGTADATIVFQQGTNDTVVELVGVTGITSVGASGTTNHLLAIG